MPSFEILADIFTCLSVFDLPKGSSNTVKTRKKYQRVFQKKAPNNISLRKPKVFALQILQRHLTKEGRVRKFFHCLYG